MIKEFQGEYRYLSNFWKCNIAIDGVIYISSEHAYQASKFVSMDRKKDIWSCESPSRAKTLAKEFSRIEELAFESGSVESIESMYSIVTKKFLQNPLLASQLQGTKTQTLQEGNHWNDSFWGVSFRTGKGMNHLGSILMEVRELLRV